MSIVKKIGAAKDPSINSGIRYSFEFDSRVDLQDIRPEEGLDVRDNVINGLAQQFKLALRVLIYGKV